MLQRRAKEMCGAEVYKTDIKKGGQNFRLLKIKMEITSFLDDGLS